VGAYLSTRNPGFDTRDYGYAKLGDLVRSLPYVEVKETGGQPGPFHVRLKPGR
jgi:hypothetical protein